MNVMLYHSIICVALLMDLFVLCAACLTVIVNFAIFLGVVVILLLSMGGGALFDRQCIVFERM